MMKTLFDLCRPRDDVLKGRIRDEEFAADLSRVVNGTAVPEYADPNLFFRYTYPTRGLKTLLETVCRRLSGKGGELNSVIRLDTQYGGGKTHSLIALVHAVRGMKGVGEPAEFIDPGLLPSGRVRVAALSGENADPANGLRLEPDLLTRSLWGEMAYRLAGRAGFERVRMGDEKHIAPGADTIAELFGDEPVLILIDEVSVYLRRAARAFSEGVNQFSAFIHALIKAVSATPKAALVCTLAIRPEDQKAADAYEAEHHLAARAFEETLSVASRKLLQIDPTEEDETVNVLQRRLFERVDLEEAQEVVDGYARLWKRNRDTLASDAMSPEIRDQFIKGYPLHPETLNVMTEKMSSLSTFQRTRGMLRLLARTVHRMWDVRPPDAFAVHPHHIDPGHPPIRSEFTTKLNQSAFSPALSADIAAVSGKDPAISQKLDHALFPGQAPVVGYVARTIFLNTMAFGDAAQGVSPEHLRYSIASPAIDPALVEAARKAFIRDSLYLDDRPGAPLRFRVEPNLTQIINRAMNDVNPDDMRSYLDVKIKDLFKGGKNDFELITFPAGPRDVPDDTGSGKPYLVVLHYDAHSVSDTPAKLPQDLVNMATRKGVAEDIRIFENNLVFIMADQKLTADMKVTVRRRLALEAIQSGPVMKDLADYQRNKIRGFYSESDHNVAIAILQCYRHMFYPSSYSVDTGDAGLAHTAIELPNTSDDPGHGQQYIRRALRDQKKLLMAGDAPDAPVFVRDQTPLKTRGQISISELLNEYRKAPNLSILLDTAPLIECIRAGIEQEVFIYREGEQLWGKGDPAPSIRISENAFIHTLEDAKKRGIWPRPEPETVEPEPETTGDKKPETEKWKKPVDPRPETREKPVFSAEGPLKQALVHIFENARSKTVSEFESMTIRLYDFKGAWIMQQALATFRDADVKCRFDMEMEAEGINRFQVRFDGILQKAGAMRSFIEPQLRSAKDHAFNATYDIRFKTPLSTDREKAEAFMDMMTRYGGAEANVEAAPCGK